MVKDSLASADSLTPIYNYITRGDVWRSVNMQLSFAQRTSER